MSKSRISICIPNYKRSSHLLKLLDDIQKQTIKPFEVIIQDDCSNLSDFTKIKKGLSKEYRLHINKKNLGLMKNINSVVKKAQGDYLAIVHNDDRISKYYIEEFTKALEHYPKYNIYTSNSMGITVSESIIGDFRFFSNNKMIKKRKDIKELWKKSFFTFMSITGATLYRTSFIKKNLFIEKYGNEADLERALYFLTSENIMYIDKPIYFTLLHKDQESYKNKLSKKRLDNYIINCLKIYKLYEPQFKTFVPNYLQMLKAIYLLQLFLKYKYPIRKIKILLELNSLLNFLNVLFYAPLVILSIIYQRINFRLNLKIYNQYF